MLIHITEVRLGGGCRLHLRFDDGIEGDVDISELVPCTGVFAALKDPAFFERVTVDPEWGTIRWPTDLDLAPEPLYERITGRNPMAGASSPPSGVVPATV